MGKQNDFFLKKFARITKCPYLCTAFSKIGVWCNGNTTDSGPVIYGSSPYTPTNRGECPLQLGFGLRGGLFYAHTLSSINLFPISTNIPDLLIQMHWEPWSLYTITQNNRSNFNMSFIPSLSVNEPLDESGSSLN